MAAWGCKFSLLVLAVSLTRSLDAQSLEILLALKDKICIPAQPCKYLSSLPTSLSPLLLFVPAFYPFVLSFSPDPAWLFLPFYINYVTRKPLDYFSLILTTDLTCQVANSHLKNDIYFEFWLTIYITMIRNYIHVPCRAPTIEPTTSRLPFRDPCFATLETTPPP